jgi:hypothetical protein
LQFASDYQKANEQGYSDPYFSDNDDGVMFHIFYFIPGQKLFIQQKILVVNLFLPYDPFFKNLCNKNVIYHDEINQALRPLITLEG